MKPDQTDDPYEPAPHAEPPPARPPRPAPAPKALEPLDYRTTKPLDYRTPEPADDTETIRNLYMPLGFLVAGLAIEVVAAYRAQHLATCVGDTPGPGAVAVPDGRCFHRSWPSPNLV